MTSLSTLNSFHHELKSLLEIIVTDPFLENIWLNHLSFLEDQGGIHIIKAIGPTTEQKNLPVMIAHAQDEHRHADKLQGLIKKNVSYPDHKYYLLEKEWMEIGKNFLTGFFSEPLLRKMKKNNTAYVYGLNSIQRLPFRVYELYLSMTHNKSIKEGLMQIMEEKFKHMDLGRKLFTELKAEEKLPLTPFYELEEKYSLVFLRRMNVAFNNIWDLAPSSFMSTLEKRLLLSKKAEVAFHYVLSLIEEKISPLRHQFLKSAITLERTRLRKEAPFLKIEPTLIKLASPYLMSLKNAEISHDLIAARLNNLYERLLYQSNNISLAYAYFSLLSRANDETNESSGDHLSMQREFKLWEDLCERFLAMDL